MTWEAIPCQLFLCCTPQFAPEENFRTPKHVRLRGVTTLPTTFDDARLNTEARIRHVRYRLRMGDHQALVNLIDDSPEFVNDPWVKDELVKWLATGRSYRRPGRQMGSFIRHPLVVVGAVDELLKRDWVDSKAEAFRWLQDRGWLSANTARDTYYQSPREERFQAALFQDTHQARLITEEELDHAVSEAVVLEPGKTITHTLAEFPEGPLTLTFEGL